MILFYDFIKQKVKQSNEEYFEKIVNRKVGNSEIVEVEQLNPEEEENIFLPIASDALNITEQYNQIVFFIKRVFVN